MRIGVIEGATRPGSNTSVVTRWVLDHAPEGVEVVHLPLTEHVLPLFDWEKHPMAAGRQYPSEAIQAWADAVNDCDGFVFVVPEYNHGVPGGLKNAIDWLGSELWGKASAFVGVGADGGTRAVEQLRLVLANFNQFTIRSQVSLSIFRDIADGKVQASDQKNKDLAGLYQELTATVAQLKG
ncbi:NADPH-dependent FMN reductase [Arachnia propionica]|nr:NAD(P)H-dependent oxidoreductase [Arachnia propionica]MDO5084632.1 NAD(P)H-dependent oxidoreductase [Arachnia propionica]